MFTHYINIDIKTSDSINECTEMFYNLHGVFTLSKDYVYATAFPSSRNGKYGFRKIRIFSSESGLKCLVDKIRMTSNANLSSIKIVPDECEWVQYSKYRIPSRKSMAKNHKKSMRNERIVFADNNCFHFNIKSQTNHTRFKLYIREEIGERNKSDEVIPDLYGLSVSTRPFSVPLLPEVLDVV